VSGNYEENSGGTILGLILGMIVGLGAALAVAIYVTKVPVPFLNKGAARTDQDEAERNKNWDPNAPLPASAAKPPAPVARQPGRPAPPRHAHHAADQGPAAGAGKPPASPGRPKPASPPCRPAGGSGQSQGGGAGQR
jgi:hypothetical protein